MFTHETFSSQLDFINVHSHFQYLKASILIFFNFVVEAGARVASIPTQIQTDFAATVFEQTLKTAASRHNCHHTLPKKNNLQLLIGDFK